jgi:hypothetical protein
VVFTGLTLLVLKLLKRFRDQNAKGQQTLDELLGNFSEMERRGDISPEEYRKITAVVGEPDGSKCQDDLHTRDRSDA